EGKPWIGRPERMDRIEAAGLQEDREAVLTPEVGEKVPVVLRKRLQVTHRQGHAVEVGRRLTGDEFDLRNLGPRLQAVDQRGKQPDLFPHLRDDGPALPDLGNETRVTLAEADQRA